MAPRGLFIMRNISGPPVRRKRHTSNAAKIRNAMLSQVVQFQLIDASTTRACPCYGTRPSNPNAASTISAAAAMDT
jgi:hypothetical protein